MQLNYMNIERSSVCIYFNSDLLYSKEVNPRE